MSQRNNKKKRFHALVSILDDRLGELIPFMFLNWTGAVLLWGRPPGASSITSPSPLDMKTLIVLPSPLKQRDFIVVRPSQQI